MLYETLTLLILINYSKHIDTISMEVSILQFKGLSFIFLLNGVHLSLKIDFILTNSADSDEMSPYATFHLSLTVCPSTCLRVSKMKRAKNKLNK